MGGRGSKSGGVLAKRQSWTIADMTDRLETYVGGGYEIDALLTDDDIAYMNAHEATYQQPLYRLEEARFTASKIDGMDDDDDIDLGSAYRSFTRGGLSTLRDIADEFDEGGMPLDDYVVIRTIGKTRAFDMGPYAENYGTDQKEVLVGGDFEFLGEGTITVNGRRFRRIDLRQI